MKENKQKPSRQIRLCQSWRRVNKAPVLTLEGLWLQQSGFDIGDLVQITPGKEELTIKILEKWESGRSNSV
ncbi:MAG: SymE family type I addiction module toxin [Mangrovibacterium sp.]|nr:SymE family type I addiction module toxin [Mangrovibacterium sp.]